MGIQKYSTLINFVFFQLCWFGCVLGAANDLEWLGPLLVLIAVPPQIYWLTDRYREESFFVLGSGLCGFFLETLLINGGVYAPQGAGDLQVSPPWMVALWINFGMLVSLSLSWLKGKHLLAAALGTLAGPLAWWGGEKLGALSVSPNFVQGYFLLALVWAVVLPTLVSVHNRFVSSRAN